MNDDSSDSNSSEHIQAPGASKRMRKRRCIYSNRKKNAAARLRRQYESLSERDMRLAQDRLQHQARRVEESQSDREDRLTLDRFQHQARREEESLSNREIRIAQMRQSRRTSRAAETRSEHELRIAQMRQSSSSSRAAETRSEHELRIAQMRQSRSSSRAAETRSEHELRIAQMRQSRSSSRAAETRSEHELRIAQMRQSRSSSRAAETRSEHELRIDQMRQSRRTSRATETRTEHSNRVSHIRERRHSRREQIDIANISARPEAHYFGRMDKQCVHCRAYHFNVESNDNGSFNSCCNHGKVVLNTSLLSDFPELFHGLLLNDNNESVEFRKNIRNYNSSLALASMGAKLSVPPGRGPYCYKIHGQVYHNVGPLHPETRHPSYGQLYIMDTDMAATERMNNPANADCDPDLMRRLGEFISNNNAYAQAYKMMYEVEEQEQREAVREGRRVRPTLMIFKEPTYEERHRFNVPVSNEVALIFVGDEVPEERSLAVHSRNNRLTILRDTDEKCDPMTYPIFYPNGGFGWNIHMEKAHVQARGRKRLTQREYYAYLLHTRREFSPLFYAGKLFQQWIVDSWARTEQNRLYFLRTHQPDLRADSYRNITDFLAGDNVEGSIGMKVVLPSTFQSGPRGMQQNYQDAMAIVARYGKPDYFLTFTCNPTWREIVEQLMPNGQTGADRPDLIARVFELKLRELLNDLTAKKVIGEVLAFVYVIEFQKRGLPHCHMLLTMKSAWKPRNSVDVDRLISAELPDEIVDPQLHFLVSTLMIHRPCGINNPQSTCMREGKCSKKYPMPFTEHTEMETNGYPKYKRSNNGRSIMLKNIEVDNRWVVPYNPFFILKYQAHMNLEVCALIMAVMYLFKYVYKGEDRAKIEIRQVDEKSGTVIDEIAKYINARYLCSPEGVHRLLEYKMQGKSHHIERLALHLPEQQTVQFEVGKEDEALEKGRTTKLTAYFALNQKCEQYFASGISGSGTNLTVDSRDFFYNEIPEHYTWKDNEWKERLREGKPTIGRMYTVSPKEKERFSLRILLLNRKGAKAYADLRTVNNEVFPSFTEAAKELGLLHDDTHYILCMNEAKEYQLPVQLRSLFACLLCFTEIHEPQVLWDSFKDFLSADFVYRGNSISESYIRAYYDIADRVAVHTVALDELIVPPGARPVVHEEPVDYHYYEEQGSQMYDSLSEDQKYIVDKILESISRNLASSFYVDGPGGCGKTFVYNCIYNILVGRRKKIMNVSWTGIAANLLYNGRTVCSAFKLDIGHNCDRSTMTAQSQAAKLILDSDIIIWDEAPMAPKLALKAIDVLLQDLTKNDQPFGGKILLLGGDFRQVLPIVEHGSEEDMIEASIRTSDLWRHFKKFSLTRNLRLLDPVGNNWANTLLEIGNGNYPKNENGEIELDEELYLEKDGDLIGAVFGDFQTLSLEEISKRTILAPKNVDVFELNEEVLSRMGGLEREYHSIDELEAESNEDEMIQNFPTEFLNNMTPTGMPPHVLKLKKGALVMVLRNIDVKEGLVNGCRLIVNEMRDHTLLCKFVTGTKKGEMVIIPRIELKYDKGIPFILRRRQFPVRLCFAMTINKAQGQSFERVGIRLSDQVFGHGQLYVALSRATSKSGIIIDSPTRLIRNVVLKEALE